MHKKYPERHFLSHTLEHLLGVFVIITTAASIGYFASAQTAPLSNVVTSPLPPPPPTSTLVPTPTPVTTSVLTTGGTSVSFSATPAPETDCSSGKPMTKVFLAVSNALGGSFEVTSDSGMSNARLEWGEYPLPNGKYMWRGIPEQGFVSSGDDSGVFELRGTCLAYIKDNNDWMMSSLPLDYPETSLATVQIFDGTALVSDGGTVPGNVSFVVASPNATRLGFALVSPGLDVKFFGADQGVTHDSALHTWKLNWNSSGVRSGDYVLIAILDTSEGVLRSSKKIFHVSNATLPASPGGTSIGITDTTSIKTASGTPLSPASSEVQLPRPLLKVFFDNKPVTDPRRIFNDEDIELRVIVPLAKKVNLVAVDNNTNIATQLGNGVIDDLLTTPGMDIWTYVWSALHAKEGSYKVFARILRTDGTTLETVPVVLNIAHSVAAPAKEVAESPAQHSSTIIAPSERQQILERVSDPANCTNAEECKIFCSSHSNMNDQCAQFSRVSVSTLDVSAPSLSDGISDLEVVGMLNDPHKRPKELPEVVASADDFRAYCAQSSHDELCTKALLSNDLASSATLEQKKTDITRAHEEETKLFSERVGARMFIDGDDDGITDYDEVNIYHTNPNDLDTDHDGFLDGAEILAGTNPRGTDNALAPLVHPLSGTSTEPTPHPSEEMGVENPLISGTLQAALLSVTDVTAAEVGLGEKGTTTVKKLKLSGKSLPNSFVRIYIFSDPIVVTVKADESGAWTYTLDKELPDGTHQVISAITDSGGHILAKSEALPFVKEAAAVSLGIPLLPKAAEAPGFFSGTSLYAFIAIIVALLGLGLSVIGFMVFRKGEGDEPTPAV